MTMPPTSDASGAGEPPPFVSVIVPCRNERPYVAAFVESLRRQDYNESRIEFLIADGLSDDGTVNVLEALAREDHRVRVLANPGLSVSHGLNLAIRHARGEVVVRMDVHTSYAEDYVSRCVDVLLTTGAQCVGGPWQAVGETYLQRAIAVAFRSRLGSGGAPSHAIGFKGAVDSVYLGCWRRDTLLEAGLFDEELVRNQDDELCLRLRRSGARLWQDPSIRSEYRPRGSLGSLFRQYFQYGYWKVRVIRKHGQPASWRHLVPAMTVLSGVTLLIASPWSRYARAMLVSLGVVYFGLVLAASVRGCVTAREWRLLPVLPLAFAVYHAGYGLGFCRGIVDFLILRRQPVASVTALTR